mgnify:CR=1 FL=1
MEEICDECGEPLEDDALYFDEEMTQFCCQYCADLFDTGVME